VDQLLTYLVWAIFVGIFGAVMSGNMGVSAMLICRCYDAE
jgi:hypothetical protein